MALAVVHVDGANGVTATILTPSWTSVSGSLLVVVVAGFNNGRAPVSGDVNDNKGNTYTLAVSNFGGASAVGSGVWYTNGGAAGAGHVITFSMPGQIDAANITVVEVTGQDTTSAVFDASTDATSTDASSPYDVTAAAAITGNQIAIYGVTLDTGANTPFSNPAGYSEAHTAPDGGGLVSYAGFKLNETGTPTVGASSAHAPSAGREVFATFYESGSVPGDGTPNVPLSYMTWGGQ